MVTITAALVKELREKHRRRHDGLQAALTQTDGDFEAAVDWLRKKGLQGGRESCRVAAEVLVAVLTAISRASSSN